MGGILKVGNPSAMRECKTVESEHRWGSPYA